MSMAVEIDPDNTKIRDTREFRRSGSSTILSFPPQILETLNFERGDQVEIEGDWSTGEITLRRVDDEE